MKPYILVIYSLSLLLAGCTVSPIPQSETANATLAENLQPGALVYYQGYWWTIEKTAKNRLYLLGQPSGYYYLLKKTDPLTENSHGEP